MKIVSSLSLSIFAALLFEVSSYGADFTETASGDPVIKACQDEIARSIKDLHVEHFPAPYFIIQSVKEVDQADISSTFGSPAYVGGERKRCLITRLSVGDATLDSSKFSTDTSVEQICIDPDYKILRRAIWLQTDKAYKSAIRDLEAKRAYIIQKGFANRLPEMVSAPIQNSIREISNLDFDRAEWAGKAEKLSTLFTAYPALQKSKVIVTARSINRWLVTSESTTIRDNDTKFAVIFHAEAEAGDGMPVADYEMICARQAKDLPDLEMLSTVAKDIAQRVNQLAGAPAGEDYCGPVLFEGQAAAEFFSNVMAPNFGYAEEYLFPRWRHPLKGAVGHRILPTFIDVVDDPLKREFNGTPLIGGYDFDDEGVRAEKVRLVENGVLKNLCQSRTPTKHSAKSNGHSVSGSGMFSIIEISSSKTCTKEELKQKLIEMGKEVGLDYVLIVRRMVDYYKLIDHPTPDDRNAYTTSGPRYSQDSVPTPIVYKLYVADGHEELVRGLEFRSVSLRAFKDIQACADDKNAYLVEPADYTTRHLITPSFIVGELDLTPIRRDFDSLPLIPNPLSELNSTKK